MICQELSHARISLNTIKITGRSVLRRIEEMDEFEKCVPAFVNGQIYLSERPNDIINE